MIGKVLNVLPLNSGVKDTVFIEDPIGQSFSLATQVNGCRLKKGDELPEMEVTLTGTIKDHKFARILGIVGVACAACPHIPSNKEGGCKAYMRR